MKIFSSLLLVLLVTLICAPLTLSAQQEKREFSLIQDKKIIGVAIATRTIDGTETTYSDDTNIEIHMVVKVKVSYGYDEVYVDGDLSKAAVLILVHGHEHTNASTFKSKDIYSFKLDNDAPVKITEPIDYSTVQLLFEEPKGYSKVYSAEHGNFHKLKKTGEHTYLKTSHEGHENTYYYKDGHLQKAEINAGMISLTMLKK